MREYTLKVHEIIRQTNDTITLRFKQPGLRKITYIAGQYITLVFRINGRKYARPYSFSSAPSVDSFLEVTIKRVEKGIVSNYIYESLKAGDIIEVLEPMGDFTCTRIDSKSTIYLWGVGSGITPLFSIIKEILTAGGSTKVHLIYGNKTRESTIFHDQLTLFQQEYPDFFTLTNFYSKDSGVVEGNGVNPGRITSDFVTQFVSINGNVKDSIHYICGPSGLKDTIKSSLLKIDVPLTSVFVEEFVLTVNPKELEDVADSNVTVFFEGSASEIFVPKGKTILDVSLDKGIEIPYSCQTGNCSSCKATVTTGKVKMLGLTKTRGDLGPNEFLLCCSFPLTNEVTLEVNKY